MFSPAWQFSRRPDGRRSRAGEKSSIEPEGRPQASFARATTGRNTARYRSAPSPSGVGRVLVRGLAPVTSAGGSPVRLSRTHRTRPGQTRQLSVWVASRKSATTGLAMDSRYTTAARP